MIVNSSYAVITAAGDTIDGIMELEEGKLRVTLIKAVVKATSRGRVAVREVAFAPTSGKLSL